MQSGGPHPFSPVRAGASFSFFLIFFINCVVGGNYWGFCKDTCEKHRRGRKEAFTLDCNDEGSGDPDCNRHCWFCKDDICDDDRKVYSCPAKEADLSTIVILVVVGIFCFGLCICGIMGCVYCNARNRRRAGGGGALMMNGGGGMYAQPVPSVMSSSAAQIQYQPQLQSIPVTQQSSSVSATAPAVTG